MSKFPDGQLDPNKIESPKTHRIANRFSSWGDLQEILCKTAIYKSDRALPSLYVPYFFGSRSDRDFGSGINYFRDVIAPIINAQGYKWVETLDPHSLNTVGAINNLREIPLNPIIFEAIKEPLTSGIEGITIVSPDFGAYKKVWSFCEYLNEKTGGHLDIDFISCEKIRNLDGKILHTKIHGTPKYDQAIIIDDICDGGRTFIEISKQITRDGFKGDLSLWVTHGIFSKGLRELSKHFKKIYTTNSVQDINSLTDFGWQNERYLDLVEQTKVI